MKKLMLISLLSLLLVSCAVEITPPNGFITLEEPGYSWDYKAKSADGVVIAIREKNNIDKAPIDFWVKAFTNDQTKNKGMTMVGDSEFETIMGKGKALVFENEQDGVQLVYIIGLVATDSTVYVIEAGGHKELVDPDKKAIIESFKSLK